MEYMSKLLFNFDEILNNINANIFHDINDPLQIIEKIFKFNINDTFFTEL